MKVAVAKETFPAEKRVALAPNVVPSLIKAGLEVLIERGAGQAAGFPDSQYEEKGAKIVDSREAVFDADIVLQVRAAGANPVAGASDAALMKKDQTIIAACEPLSEPKAIEPIAKTGATLFALELLPRITRAQSMDILSSMATVAGYRAVLIAAEALPKMFPMMMTAAGTIKAARVFIIGAGVAGLQAIATAKRLGAVVTAYDVRPAVKEQCQSLGAKFLELELETTSAEDRGGYAQAMGEDFYKKQREMMLKVVAENDVIITTAAIPGKKAPILVTTEMVEAMQPGSVIVDLAAERGGNCELTEADKSVEHGGVLVIGPTNMASGSSYHASQMYAKNITTFLLHMIDKGELKFDMEDEVVVDTMLTRGGKVVNARVCEALGIAVPSAEPEPEPAPEPESDEEKPDVYDVKRD
jgi:NAD(P) transhydrogenase subunit alpha